MNKPNYMAEVDVWLTAVLAYKEEETEDEWLVHRVKTQIKAKLLESYRNGQAAGPRASTTNQNDMTRESEEQRRHQVFNRLRSTKRSNGRAGNSRT
jgi:hypothetical protein